MIFYNLLSQKLIPLSLQVFCGLTEIPKKQFELLMNFSWSAYSVLLANTWAEHLVVVGIEPVTFQLQVGLTQSSCMSAASRLKSASDVPADDSAGDSQVRWGQSAS